MLTGPTYHYIPGDVSSEELHAGHPKWDDVPTTGAPEPKKHWLRRVPLTGWLGAALLLLALVLMIVAMWQQR